MTLRTALFALAGAFLRRRRLALYRTLLRDAADSVDIVDLHLYQDAYTIPATIDFFRRTMAAYGYQRPIFIGEYNGPAFIDFPENMAQMPTVMRAMHSLSKSLGTQDAERIARFAAAEAQVMSTMYAQMDTLPPQTRMFMEGCEPKLEAKRNRINCRDLVMRNMLALSSGVSKTFCFNLAPDLAGRPHQVLNLMFNKYRLMDHRDGALEEFLPPAHAFRHMTAAMEGVELVRRLAVPAQPAIQLFEVSRRERPPMLVAWQRQRAYDGEQAAPVSFEWPWPAATASARDVFGEAVPVQVDDGTLRTRLSVTPAFFEP